MRSVGAAAAAGNDLVTKDVLEARVASAGGATPRVGGITPVVGEWVSRPFNNNNKTLMQANSLVDLVPYELPFGTYDAVRVRVDAAGAAGSTIQVGIYESAQGSLGAFVTQTATMDGSLTGLVTALLPVPLVIDANRRSVFAGAVGASTGTMPTLQVWSMASVSSLPWAVRQASFADDWYDNFWGLRITASGGFPSVPSSIKRDVYNTTAHKIQFRRSA